MAILGIDHVAIAVKDLESATENYRDFLTSEPRFEDVPEQGVRVAAFDVGESRIELIESLQAGSPVGRFLEEQGEGLHHIALRTDSIDEELDRVDELDITCIDSKPRDGADGYRIGFVHPRDLNGTLIELVQPLIRVNQQNDRK